MQTFLNPCLQVVRTGSNNSWSLSEHALANSEVFPSASCRLTISVFHQKSFDGQHLRRRSLYPTELRVHALIYKEFSDFFESFTEPILLTSANTFPPTHGYRRFFGLGPMLANLPEKINFRTDSCSGQESFSLLRLPSAVLLGDRKSIRLCCSLKCL